jgi:hypothetical protein
MIRSTRFSCTMHKGETVRITILKIAAALLLTTGLAATGGFGKHALFAREPAAESEVTAQVDRLVKAWEPVEAERRFDDIGWAKTFAMRSAWPRSTTGLCSSLPTVVPRTANMP